MAAFTEAGAQSYRDSALNAHLDQFDRDLRRDDRVRELAANPAKVEEAHEWLEGTFDSSWYAEVQRTLAVLHDTHPADLSGSAVLATLYRLARPVGEALDAQLEEMAERDAVREGER